MNLIYDMAWYNDHIYICGNFGDGNGIRDIAYYDGTAWASVGGGFGGAFSLVNLMEEHNGLLYVAGAFARTQPYGPSDNPGCGIVTWDGTNWGQLGEGTCGSVNPAIYRMTWIQDTLYVTGRFDRIGGVPTGRVGRWDGTRWCSLVPPNYFYPDIGALGAFRDTLLIGGTFWIAGTDSIERVAKWVGGNYTSACGGPTGLDAIQASCCAEPVIFPNPANDRIRIEFPSSTIGEQLVLFDATGRVVETWWIDRSTMDLDLSHLALGSYAGLDHGWATSPTRPCTLTFNSSRISDACPGRESAVVDDFQWQCSTCKLRWDLNITLWRDGATRYLIPASRPFTFALSFATGVSPKRAMRPIRILAQPDDSTCGPTALHAVYASFGLRPALGAGDR